MEVAEITFLNAEENPEHIGIIKKALSRCYEEEAIQEKGLYVDIILTNGKHIRELNKKYRDIDKETDVLSFPMFERDEITKMDGTTKNVLGDIVISLEQVEKQAKEYGHSFERELSYMVVHSFYHLIGYDHLKDDDKTVMREKEKKIMNELI
ncbi:MAG: rRNA maturation RNase YbeY [Oscillospiraceae bacterium]|nr:rRNA maturation RNase YbeY [Oscillospiraceae bacterium]